MAAVPQSGAMRRHPTIKDVASAAEVSTVTVSRVVNAPRLVQPETRSRVERAMRELGYVPNLAAQAMRTNATRTIGFVVPDLTNYPNAAVAKATEAVLAEAGYCLLLTNSDNRLERELKSLEVLTSRRVDGMILYVCDEDDERLRQAVAAVGVPLVVLDRDLPVESDTVLSDHDSAMGEAVRYLVALGHRRLALLSTHLRLRPPRERQRAFRAWVEACGLDPSEQTVVEPSPDASNALPLVLELIDRRPRPTAIVADGSRFLRSAIQALRLRRLGVPEDLSLIGIDAADIAGSATPEITCIVRDFAEIGRTAAELMLRRLKGGRQVPPQRVVLESSVVLKGSCAAPPPG
jgi:LacI family transcriptional regulator